MQNPETTTIAPHEADHEALMQMLETDKATGISPEDAQAYHELIDDNREASKAATIIEVKDANTGAENIHVAHSIGNAALNNPMAVHSEGWKTHEQNR